MLCNEKYKGVKQTFYSSYIYTHTCTRNVSPQTNDNIRLINHSIAESASSGKGHLGARELGSPTFEFPVSPAQVLLMPEMLVAIQIAPE